VMAGRTSSTSRTTPTTTPLHVSPPPFQRSNLPLSWTCWKCCWGFQWGSRAYWGGQQLDVQQLDGRDEERWRSAADRHGQILKSCSCGGSRAQFPTATWLSLVGTALGGFGLPRTSSCPRRRKSTFVWLMGFRFCVVPWSVLRGAWSKVREGSRCVGVSCGPGGWRATHRKGKRERGQTGLLRIPRASPSQAQGRNIRGPAPDGASTTLLLALLVPWLLPARVIPPSFPPAPRTPSEPSLIRPSAHPGGKPGGN